MDDRLSRQRGILSPEDRRYLTGEKELSGQSERNARARIRERIYNGILDFGLLWYCLEERDLEMVFARDDVKENRDLRRYIQDMLAFAILGMEANDDAYPDRIKAAIEQAGIARDYSVAVTLDVKEERMDDTGMILTRILDSEFENISFNELEKVWEDPDCDPELFARFLNMLEPEEEFTVEWVEEYQESLRELGPRPSVAYALNVEPVWSDESTVPDPE